MDNEFLSIDLGSNTLRAAIFTNKNQTISKTKSIEFIVGSAKNLSQTGLIGDEAIGKIHESLKRVLSSFELDSFSKISYKAVATEAFRKALNSDKIFNDIFVKFGIKFKVISAKAEGKLSFLGIQEAVKSTGINSDDVAFIDLGGASTEIGDQSGIKSFDLGIITFYEQCDKTLLNVLKQSAQKTKLAKEYLKSINKKNIALTSGIPTTVAALRLGYTWQNYDAKSINGYVLDKEEFAKLGAEVLAMNDEQANIKLGTDRKMLVLTGLSILEAMLRDIDAKLIVIDDGLREGIAIAYFKDELEKIINLKE